MRDAAGKLKLNLFKNYSILFKSSSCCINAEQSEQSLERLVYQLQMETI